MSNVRAFISKYFKDTVKYRPNDCDGEIGLPYRFTTPCANEMFVNMFYWDTYFTNVGLIAEGNIELAKNNADNMRFLINKLGFMPNSNNILCNSQPPFYYKMVEDVFEVTKDKEWLKESYDALAREHNFWQTERIAPNGLNVYGPHKDYDESLIEWRYNYFKSRYKAMKQNDRGR